MRCSHSNNRSESNNPKRSAAKPGKERNRGTGALADPVPTTEMALTLGLILCDVLLQRRMPRSSSKKTSLPVARIDEDRDRSVIDEADLHIGSELPALYRLAQICRGFAQKGLIERDRDLRPGGAAVGRAISFARAGE